jgi:hypothetical protein
MTTDKDAMRPSEDPTSDELWLHVLSARRCVEDNPTPEAIGILRAHLASYEAHFLENKVLN